MRSPGTGSVRADCAAAASAEAERHSAPDGALGDGVGSVAPGAAASPEAGAADGTADGPMALGIDGGPLTARASSGSMSTAAGAPALVHVLWTSAPSASHWSSEAKAIASRASMGLKLVSLGPRRIAPVMSPLRTYQRESWPTRTCMGARTSSPYWVPTSHTAALMQVTAGACPSTGVTSWPLMVMTPAESTSAWMTGWVKAMPRRSGVIFCMAVSFFGDASGKRQGRRPGARRVVSKRDGDGRGRHCPRSSDEAAPPARRR